MHVRGTDLGPPMRQLPNDPRVPETAEEAEQEARRLVAEVLEMLSPVSAPAARREQCLVEQLSFLQARENYRAFATLLDAGDDVPAATLARALFEEAMRWAWVDEEPEQRRAAFLGEAARAHRLIREAAREQEIDPGMFFAPLVDAELLPAAADVRFPVRFEALMDWMPDSGMHYLQYRILSQYVHSSLLEAASTAVEANGELTNARQLPIAARLTAIRNAVASIAVVFDFTKAGLSWPGALPMNMVAFAAAARMARITLPFAPAAA
jgi:hypothetical protein